MKVTINILTLFGFIISSAGFSQKITEKVLVDKGVLKWSDSGKEVALFGANYCLPSACDYRAAGYFTSDRKKVIDDDMIHFARMGWDGLRVCLWGDWENSDEKGNLINNDHLDLMDYLIKKASDRGIFMLLSPIVTYSSQWPDAMMDKDVPGFSNHFKKSEMGTSPAAIAAQVNYLKQLLNHVNPYTHHAIKDEPNILFVEMINEPWHHSDDVKGSINYINALVDAVRSTGCKKILFHNISQDFAMAEPIQKSKVQGVTFAWYPTGLNSGRTLTTNYLRTVDHYDLMFKPALKNLAKIVYEFDTPDLLSPTLYPAMVRTFRSVGAQFATIFSYDMLISAAYNLGWQTHYINLVYTPQKAVSAIIAAEAMRQLPRMKSYGEYPENTSFGNFRINYAENVSEFNTPETFMYAGSTKTKPLENKSLTKIVGFGSSPIVNYEGEGIYFLDKVADGVWRLEVYPDAVLVRNPFGTLNKDAIASRVIHNVWDMKVALPDLGLSFQVKGIHAHNQYIVHADSGSFKIKPGIYLITKDGVGITKLPQNIGALKFDEFIAPDSHQLPVQIINTSYQNFSAGQPVRLNFKIFDDQEIDSANLFIRGVGSWFHKVKLTHEKDYDYGASIPEIFFNGNYFQYCVAAYQYGEATTYPGGIKKSPRQWGFSMDNFWEVEIKNKNAPIDLFQPGQDAEKLSFTRIGDNQRQGIFKLIASSTGSPAFRLSIPIELDKSLEDYTASLAVKDRIQSRSDVVNAFAVDVDVRGLSDGSECYITLVESDGTSWATKIIASSDQKIYRVPIHEFVLAKSVMLPLGFPGQWNYWVAPPMTRAISKKSIQLTEVEELQISVRPASIRNSTGSNGIEISSIKLILK